VDDQANNTHEPAEGVRLVGRREAEAAIQSGQAISRLTLDEKPFSGTDEISVEPDPRPDTVATQRPIVIGGQRAINLRDEIRLDDDVPEEHMSISEGDDEDLPENPASSNLPHWTEPPTGEMPLVLSEMNDDPPESQSPTDWSLSSLGEASGLGGAVSEIDFDSFDDDPFDHISEVPAANGSESEGVGVESEASIANGDEERAGEDASVDQGADPSSETDDSSSGRTSTPPRPNVTDPTMEKVELLKKSSLTQRLSTGIAFAVLAALAFMAGPKWVLTLTTVTVLLAAMEYFDAVRRVGYRPPTALGLMSVLGAVLGVYARGEAAIPLVLALVTIFTFLWYLGGVIESSPTANTAITLLGIIWTGIFGSFSALLLREPHRHGVAFILGAVLCVVAYDTAAYIGGTLMGKHALAPHISPGKTWEGLACASIASVLVGALIVQAIHPWSFGGGALLGVVVAIVAPIGDLAESMVKRDLGLKDMGRILPGHGGIFDRFDAMLLVLPATYYLVRMLNLA
jgi:phosphatidate cytidylyltransferase